MNISFKGLFSAIAPLLVLSACEPLENGVEVVREAGRVTKVLMNESFERSTLLSVNPALDPFGWRGFIWDYGTPVIGTNGTNVGSLIMDNTQMGQASEGSKALYFYGRDGSSTHAIHLFTHSYDLSNFDEVEIAFDHMTYGLNDNGDSIEEFLKLEVCADTALNCGVGATINNTKLASSAWKTLFKDTGASSNPAFTGKNHLRTDWGQKVVRLNIANFPKKDTFTLRFTAYMTDGFTNNDRTRALKDGAAIDNIRVVASASKDPNETGPTDPNCLPNVSVQQISSCYDLPFEFFDPLGL